MQRSKNKEYMSSLIESVREGVKSKPLHVQEFLVRYAVKQVLYNDYKEFVHGMYETPLTMPHQGFTGNHMIILQTVPTQNEYDMIYKAYQAVGLTKRDIYITYYKKAKESSKEYPFELILEGEIKVIKPSTVLIMANSIEQELSSIVNYHGIRSIKTLPFPEDDNVSDKMVIWNDLKRLIDNKSD